MSVKTTVDEEIEKAMENIEIASKHLHKAIDPTTWGYDELDINYLDKLHNSMLKLRKIKEDLS